MLPPSQLELQQSQNPRGSVELVYTAAVIHRCSTDVLFFCVIDALFCRWLHRDKKTLSDFVKDVVILSLPRSINIEPTWQVVRHKTCVLCCRWSMSERWLIAVPWLCIKAVLFWMLEVVTVLIYLVCLFVLPLCCHSEYGWPGNGRQLSFISLLFSSLHLSLTRSPSPNLSASSLQLMKFSINISTAKWIYSLVSLSLCVYLLGCVKQLLSLQLALEFCKWIKPAFFHMHYFISLSACLQSPNPFLVDWTGHCGWVSILCFSCDIAQILPVLLPSRLYTFLSHCGTS